jgi:hypothetical protein
MVTVLEAVPCMEITTGAAVSGANPAGTCALTWYNPTKPGASPEKNTSADTPPIVTAGVVVV